MDLEALAQQFRETLGIDGFPGWAGTLALAVHLGLRVEVCPDWSFALCRRWRDGTMDIWTPANAFMLAHEIGHFLLSPPTGGSIYLTSSPVGTVEHLRDEAAADRWARTWLLPGRLAREPAACEESGCPHRVIVRRLAELRG